MVTLPIEMVLQDHGRRSGIEPGLPFFPVTLPECKAAFRFAAAQPFVLDVDRYRHATPQRGDESFDHLGLIAVRAIEMSRHTHDDRGEALLFSGKPADLSGHALDRGPASDGNRGERSRKHSRGITDGDTNPSLSHIEPEHSHDDAIFCRTPMFRRFLAAAGASLTLAAALAVAQDVDRERTQQLSQRAAERLQALHDEADRLASQERSLLNDVRRLEIDREIRAEELNRARDQMRAASDDLAGIDRQIQTLTEESRAALPDLRARVVTLYKLGRGQYARLLLSASDLRQLNQAVRLVSALAEQDRHRMSQHQQRIEELNAARARAEEREAQVRRLQASAERAQAAADKALQAHAELVRDIDSRRDLNAQYASELLAAQQKLQASLGGLGAATASASLPIAPFRGELAWPVAGNIRSRFGAVAAGRPPQRGIEIDAGEGMDVQAVLEGTVAFADTFSGYGRLVIVDHGNQTFSLYGNLGRIAVAKDSRIQRGTVVGTVGLSDAGASGLYFELRVDGRTVDPLQWLAKR